MVSKDLLSWVKEQKKTHDDNTIINYLRSSSYSEEDINEVYKEISKKKTATLKIIPIVSIIVIILILGAGIFILRNTMGLATVKNINYNNLESTNTNSQNIISNEEESQSINLTNATKILHYTFDVPYDTKAGLKESNEEFSSTAIDIEINKPAIRTIYFGLSNEKNKSITFLISHTCSPSITFFEDFNITVDHNYYGFFGLNIETDNTTTGQYSCTIFAKKTTNEILKKEIYLRIVEPPSQRKMLVIP